MMRLLQSIIVALASMPLAYGASNPAGGLEVDVIFPISNATYNITQSLPIVFALQNLTAAAALGPFTFTWDIMPYGNVGETQQPGGVINDAWRVDFTTANATTDPYILVNQTDVQTWDFGPYFPDGSVYALQWAVTWNNASTKLCESDPLGADRTTAVGALFFNIDINAPEPDLKNLTGQCAQLGNVYEINTTATNSSCSAVVTTSDIGNPCAVTLDQAMVANISSTVQSLAAVSASATATTSVSAMSTSSPAKHDIAVASTVPLSYMLAVAFLPMAMSL